MQIINALKYLHAHRIIHRDLKLGNLFINDKMEVKLGDFGLAAKLDFDGEKKRTICGTPNYIAPEVLEGKSGHSYEVDVWSLGVIIYTLIVGKPPFETSDVKTTYNRIRKIAYAFPDNVVVSDAARDLISRILIGDPTQRPTLDEICAHEFLTRNTIPKALPSSLLACPPTGQYLKQFIQSTTTYATTQ
jgi:polo-like kinase 1